MSRATRFLRRLRSPAALLAIACVWLVPGRARGGAGGRRAGAAAGGALAAEARLGRPPVIAIIVFTPALLALLGADRRRILRVLGPAVAVAVLALVPWTVRNAVRFHAF